MEIIRYYGNSPKKDFINHSGEPLMAVISFDGSTAVVSPLDEGFEHHLLLKNALDSDEIDKYFRIIFDNEGADWTFVCPPDYKNISHKEKRIESFFRDGTDIITEFLNTIDYDIPINIPKRYRRHIDYLNNTEY